MGGGQLNGVNKFEVSLSFCRHHCVTVVKFGGRNELFK
jgi:hypothetical protein